MGGCLNDGGSAFLDKFGLEDDNVVDFIDEGEENSKITDGVNGKFRFILAHWNSAYESSNNTTDHKMVSDMTITVSGHKSQTFNHPMSEVDTHLPDGTVNPDYPGTVYVDMQCDTECACTFKEHVPKCEVEATLTFPAFKESYYGYHSDALSVQKVGDPEICSVGNKMTQWGCIHRGDAYILDYIDDKYVDFNQDESVSIPDVSNGTYTFTLQHYFGDYDTNYDDDHNHVGVVTVTVNGVVLNEFTHPKNKLVETHNTDGTINEAYQGTRSKDVTCTADCKCKIRQTPEME